MERASKKTKTSFMRPAHVKNYLHVFINCMIENPAFDSQTKENMTTRAADFGSKCTLPEEFFDKVAKCGVLDHLMTFAAIKAQQMLKKTDGSKSSRIKSNIKLSFHFHMCCPVEKLDDANLAGTKKSTECTLILTEGDSAKALAMAGIAVVGRDTFGVFPLRSSLIRSCLHYRDRYLFP